MRISVIIPAYNVEPYLAEAIESCLQQTEPADEIVVLDDASTDRTSEVAERFSSQVKIVRLEKNSGLSAARNRAIQASTGDWIAFLDADDCFLPRKLELQRLCIQQNPNAVVVYCGVRLRFPDGSEQDARFVPPEKIRRWLRYSCPIHTPSSAMIRRDAFNAVGHFNTSYRRGEDWDLWHRVADRYPMEAFAAIEEPLAIYRQVAGSLSSNRLQMFEAMNVIIETRGLSNRSGLKKRLLRRRILAYHYFNLATALREEGSAEYLQCIIKSLALWPFPFPHVMLPMRRYKFAAVMFLQHLGLWPNSFRREDAQPIAHPGNKP